MKIAQTRMRALTFIHATENRKSTSTQEWKTYSNRLEKFHSSRHMSSDNVKDIWHRRRKVLSRHRNDAAAAKMRQWLPEAIYLFIHRIIHFTLICVKTHDKCRDARQSIDRKCSRRRSFRCEANRTKRENSACVADKDKNRKKKKLKWTQWIIEIFPGGQ